MDPITAISGLVSTIVSRIWPDKTQSDREAFMFELTKELNQTQLLTKQDDINVQEAANPNLFVSGWRPMIGWICGAAFLWQYVVEPMVTYGCAITGHPVPTLPVINSGDMMTVLLGLLGLGGMRSWEKINNVQNKH